MAMWNNIQTGEYEGMIAETINLKGYNNEYIHAYYSRPLGKTNYPSLVLIPHMPGWDEWCRETARRFTEHGYAVICPDIYCRIGHGTPEEVSKMAREQGGVADASVVGDCEGALEFLRAQTNSNGKVGVIGMCSAGRHAYLAAAKLDFDAVADCWGAGVVPKEPKEGMPAMPATSPKQPEIVCDLTKDINCPIIGIFGNDDFIPTAAEVDKLEEIIKAEGKEYEFYRYDGAGHGLMYYHNQMYRQEAAMDAWEKVFAFFEKHLNGKE